MKRRGYFYVAFATTLNVILYAMLQDVGWRGVVERPEVD